MNAFPRPRVVVSRCLEFEACRYNGEKIQCRIVRMLKDFVDFVPVCPEKECGLGVPRDPVRLVKTSGETRMIQPASDRDVTPLMERFTRGFLESAPAVDGFLLKNVSPSCGPSNVKIYDSPVRGAGSSRGVGYFAEAVARRFPGVPVEDEGRLNNFLLREHFFTRLFALARFHSLDREGTLKDLVRFHAEHKFLLMAHNQSRMRVLGRIVANPEKRKKPEVLARYGEEFLNTLEKPPRPSNTINALMHAFGMVSDGLSAEEKRFFLNTLEEYRDERVPLSTPVYLLKGGGLGAKNDYLASQVLLEPYPRSLLEIHNTGKGRRMS
jgi:uncharacterized protein YbgA (DUF1722 family)/uncharacterized protein YbbK (DUF523 family)